MVVQNGTAARRFLVGPQFTAQLLDNPAHLAMVLARYRAAAALIGNARRVLEIGCGEGIGAGLLAANRAFYLGVDIDAEAMEVGAALHIDRPEMHFLQQDARWFTATIPAGDATVLLDVIEHVPALDEDALLSSITGSLRVHGVAVIGTPSAYASHLASPQSRAAHINLFTPDRLRRLLEGHFHVVQMLYMQDVALHLGHPEMAHYLLGVGISPR